ncbi:MAG: PP0621 family protein [Rhodocyclaceae bacterium]|nr:PP0621 family protein [Rhodocyclaceae bacterium]
MSKFLLLILFGVLLYLVVGRAKRLRQGRERPPPRAAEAMVQCAYCRVHLPLDESLPDGERRYCCEEHRRLDQG